MKRLCSEIQKHDLMAEVDPHKRRLSCDCRYKRAPALARTKSGTSEVLSSL